MRTENKYKGGIVFADFEKAQYALLEFVEAERKSACIYGQPTYYPKCDEQNRILDEQVIFEYSIRLLTSVFTDSDNVKEIKKYEFIPTNVDLPVIDKEKKIKEIVAKLKNESIETID